MSLLKYKTKELVITPPDNNEFKCVSLRFDGRIEASTIAIFQQAFEELLKQNKNHVLLDMSGVAYITSTGMGGLVKYHNLFVDKGGHFGLMRPPQPVMDVLQLLGLESLLPIYDNQDDLNRRYLNQESADSEPAEDKLTAQQRMHVMRAEATAGKVGAVAAESGDHPVVLAIPEVDLFSVLVADQLQERNVRVIITTTADETLAAIQREKAAAVIVDFLLPDYTALCRKIKLTPRTSTCSIILIYAEGQSPDKVNSLSILPNEHVIEPFAIDKLASLAHSEIQRKKFEPSFLQHELHLRFPSELKWIDKANQLMEKVLEKPFGQNKESYLAVKSSVREAIDNANRHGNKEDNKAHIDLAYLLDKEKVTVSVKDCGVGFDYRQYLDSIKGKEATELAERRSFDHLGGLGIALMLKCSDKLSYNHKGNEVTLMKFLAK